MTKIITATLLAAITAIAAQPPAQRLARTVPPAIVAMVASNAPPGAHIRVLFLRANPFAPDRAYQKGDVVIASDGAAYIAIAPVVPAALNSIAITTNTMLCSAAPNKSMILPDDLPAISIPPANLFRQINITDTPFPKLSR